MFSYLKRIDLFLLISDLGNLDLLKMTGRGKGKGAPVFDFIALGMYNSVGAENNVQNSQEAIIDKIINKNNDRLII